MRMVLVRRVYRVCSQFFPVTATRILSRVQAELEALLVYLQLQTCTTANNLLKNRTHAGYRVGLQSQQPLCLKYQTSSAQYTVCTFLFF